MRDLCFCFLLSVVQSNSIELVSLSCLLQCVLTLCSCLSFLCVCVCTPAQYLLTCVIVVAAVAGIECALCTRAQL